MNRESLTGRTALITGGAGGIGVGIAKALLAKGAAVILGDIDEEQLETSALELLKYGGVRFYTLDVTDDRSIGDLFDWADRLDLKIDILINNAGVCLAHPFLEGTGTEYETTLAVNLRGVLQTSKLFAKRLIEHNLQGNIVNIASNAAKRPYARYVEYNAAKAAVVSVTHTLSQELAPYNINVNAVCPGAVDTPMLAYCMREAIQHTNGAFDLETCRETWGPQQLQRLVDPEEVGWVVAFLSSPAAHVIRGQAINVDGGDTQF